MKISLVGPSYPAYSVVAAAQFTMNLIPESVENAAETSRAFMYGRPGLKLFATLTPPSIRAMWAGGGRLFVVHEGRESEIHEDKTIVTSPKTMVFEPALPGPAQIFSNGHQLMIISGGKVYCDNGTAGSGGVAGPDPCHFQLVGTGHTIGTNQLIRDSGDNFTIAMQGGPITVAGHTVTVAGFIDANHIITNPVLPTLTDASWNAPGGAEVTAVTGCFLDGYGIISRPPAPALGTSNDPGRQFNISGLNDFTFWNPLDFGVKEGRSDYINSVSADHEQLILNGTESTEIWQNVGSQVVNGVATFPFQRIPGAFIQTGSAAIYAPCSVALNFCFLGGSPDGQTVAYALQGFQPQRISTHAVEQRWNAGGFKVSDAVSYSKIENGHTFWVINFWQEQETWVYDLTGNLWHERACWDSAAVQFRRYKPWYHVFIPEWGSNGMHIVGDPATGKLYEQNLDFYDDDGDKIEYMRAFPHLLNEDKWGFHHRFEVYLESGAQPDGNPPLRVGLDWSDNRGHTFAHGRFQMSGQSGEYNKRVVFRRLGKSRDRVYRIGIEANSKVALIDCFLEMTPGVS